MDAIIGRTSEKKILEHVYQSNDAEFVAIYGRRRVGKPYLIRNFFQSKKSIFFQVTGIYKGLAKIQLEQFGKEIGNVFYQGASIQSPTKWMDALEELSKAMQSIPKIDILPFLKSSEVDF